MRSITLIPVNNTSVLVLKFSRPEVCYEWAVRLSLKQEATPSIGSPVTLKVGLDGFTYGMAMALPVINYSVPQPVLGTIHGYATNTVFPRCCCASRTSVSPFCFSVPRHYNFWKLSRMHIHNVLWSVFTFNICHQWIFKEGFQPF